MKCYQGINFIRCEVICNKILPCGHSINFFCYDSNKLIKCIEICNKILPCGHSVKYKCCDSNKLILCKEPCNKILPCGHQCKLLCYEKCDPLKCIEYVKKTLPCGHSNFYPCLIPIYKISCLNPCNEKLSCGHECTGTCGKCLNNTCHMPCLKKCNKYLICGHKCEELCSLECKCKLNCSNLCVHGSCHLKCFESCEKCKKKCYIGCEHGQCYKLCYELCDIGRCNEPCKNILKCGHKCIGICGERCPNLCKICNKDNECFKTLLEDEDENNNNLLYYMTKCKHIFEVKKLDNYIDNDNKISMILCPKCNSILCDEPRYQDIIKEKIKYIQQIKKCLLKINDDNEYLKKNQLKITYLIYYIKNGMLPLLNQNIYIPNLINKIQFSCQLVYKFKQNNLIKKKISTYNLLNLLKKFMIIEFIANFFNTNIDLIKKDSIEELFMINFDNIKTYFISFISFNNNKWNNLSLKINNLFLFSEYIYNNKFNEINNFSLELENALKNSNFNISEEEIKSYKTEVRNKDIEYIKSFGSIWYRCSNGHFNVFEEEQKSNKNIICSECHEKIGNLIPNIQNKRVKINVPEVIIPTKIEKKNNFFVNFFQSFFKNNNNNKENEKANNLKKNNNKESNILNNKNNILTFSSTSKKHLYQNKVLLKEMITKNIVEKIIYTDDYKFKKTFLNFDYFADYKVKKK